MIELRTLNEDCETLLAASTFKMRNIWPILVVFLLCSQVVQSQRVRVLPDMEAYANDSVSLRCEFTNAGTTKLTQVSWIFEATEGQRENIAVFHPMYGQSFPQSAFKGRVQFTQPSLENPSIKIDSVRMSDAGRYTCEYATYPSGNEQGTTTLIMLAKPRNSASPVAAQAGGSKAVVAQCEAAQGKPAATINWVTSVAGDVNSTSEPQPDGTVTVRSVYRMAPTPADNHRDVTCVITQRTQDHPQTFTMKLIVQYPPTVRIEGYDDNWYIGRTDALLICHADANPEVVNVTWTTISGKLPPTVKVVQKKLLVQKVDESVNTTFICEAKNSLGSSKNQLTATVIELTGDPANVGVLVGAILGSLLALLLVSALVAVLVMRSRRQQHGYSSDAEEGSYSNKARLFASKMTSKNGTGANNNGPIYTHREKEKRKGSVGSVTGGIIGGIIAVVVILCLIGAAVAMYHKRLQSVENGDGPPKYKPPPPVKVGSSTEMLHKSKDQTTTVTETAPLSHYEPNYYDTTAAEPITDLDDDNPISPVNGGTPSAWEGTGHPPGMDESASDVLPPYEPASRDGLGANHEAPATGVSRGESFVSAPMLV